MRRTVVVSAVCLAALLAAPASAALSDFRLPGDSAQQQPPPDRVGPVAPDVPESRAPAPTPAPTPRGPAPETTTTEPRIVLPDLPAAAPTPAPTRTAGAPATRPPAPTGEPVVTETPDSLVTDSFGPSAAATSSSPLPDSTGSPPPADQSGSFWLWALAALVGLGAIGLAGWAWLRRQPIAGPSAVPQLERPRLGPARSPADATAAEPLQITLDPLRLSLTLMNATLAYRLEVANRGAAPIVDLVIGADMIAAHASMTREQQLSGPGNSAATVQRIERLEPGESRIVEGEFRVPFSQIVPIRQGNVALLLPLARFRLVAEGAAPVVRTFAVGQPGAKAALQPFRLDQGPRVYPKLTQRAFA